MCVHHINKYSYEKKATTIYFNITVYKKSLLKIVINLSIHCTLLYDIKGNIDILQTH